MSILNGLHSKSNCLAVSKIFVVFLLAFVNQSQATLTLISRESFKDVGTLNTASSGNLGIVESHSNFYKRAGGPRLFGDTSAGNRGWSADLHLTSSNPGAYGRHDMAVSGAAINAGVFSCWYYFDSYNSNSSRIDITGSYVGNGNQLLKLQASPVTGTFWYNRNGLWADTDSSIAIPLRTWVELRIQWIYSGPNCTGVSADFRVAGSASWTSIYTTTTSFNPGGAVTTIESGSINGSGNTSGFRGRYGMPSLYSITAWSDRLTAINDVLDPTAGPFSWYVNPATGNDNNDGVSPTTAWATIQKINDESQFCGLFPRNGGYAAGDALYIDTSGGNLLLGTQQFLIFTSSLNVEMLGSGELQAWATIPGNVWSGPVSGTTKVYQTTLTEVNESSVLWEDDKWLNHPLGSDFATVKSSLESTPGSFWTDGTTLYVHPFNDTDPRIDNKTYTRSYNRGGGGGSALLIQVPDIHLKNLRVRKTCLAHKVNNDSILGYCYQAQGAAGGTNFYENCYGDYGSKHIFGFTDNATNRTTTLLRCTAEQGSPYFSQTPWVDYSPLSDTCTNVTNYIECVTLKPRGLIGSTEGDPTGAAWICHNNGSANYQFQQINITNCQWNGNGDTYGAVQNVDMAGILSS